jgi:large subunit ribosomal protein L21
MYAIVETGGKQYRVRPGDTIAVERLPGVPGETLDLDRVLLVGGDGTRVGAPGVAGAVVRAEVVEHARGEKIIVFRYKSKVRYRRKTGHRQALTRLRITDILVDGASAVGPAAAEAPADAAPSAKRRRAAPAAVAEPAVAELAVAEPAAAEPAAVEPEAASEETATVEADLPAAEAETDQAPAEAKEE